MIGFLRGEPVVVDEETAIVNCGGVGYEVTCTPSLLDRMAAESEISVWIYTHVREDALHLFGFQSLAEKRLFLSLIKVNGVGPKSAMHILGATTFDNLIELIQNEDAKGLSKLPKVGKKTAEQIILTLKNKLVFADIEPSNKGPSVRTEIVSALVHLGFRASDVEKVVEKMRPDTNLETGVREGLLALTT